MKKGFKEFTQFKIERIFKNVITQAKWTYNENKNMKMEVSY